MFGTFIQTCYENHNFDFYVCKKRWHFTLLLDMTKSTVELIMSRAV